MRKSILISMVVLLGLSFASGGMICKGMRCCGDDLGPAQAAINCCQPEDQVSSSVPAVRQDAPSFDFIPVLGHEAATVADVATPGWDLHSGKCIRIHGPPVFLLKSSFLI